MGKGLRPHANESHDETIKGRFGYRSKGWVVRDKKKTKKMGVGNS